MSGTSNVTKATFLEFYDKFVAATIEAARTNAGLKAVKKAAKAAGIDVKELATAYKLSQQDRDTRDAAFDTRRRYMDWLGRPLGTQGEFDLSTGSGDSPEDQAAAERHAIAEAYESGYVSGKLGAGSAFCPFDAGTEAHQQYMLGVKVGEEIHSATKTVKVKAERKPRGRKGLQNETAGDSSVVSIDFGRAAAPAK
jgi:hypothetical protein